MLRKRLLLLLLRKGIDIFSKSGTFLINQQEIVNLLIFANRHFPRKMDILVCMFVC